VSEEAENVHTVRQIWVATIATFLAKFIFSSTFILPVLLLPLGTAILVSLGWGFLILTVLSHALARSQGEAPWKIIGEHVGVAAVVIAATHWVGDLVARIAA